MRVRHVPLAFQCLHGWGNGRNENLDGEGRSGEIFRGREKWRLPVLLYEDDFVSCGKSEEDLKVIVGPLLKYIGEGVGKLMVVGKGGRISM